MKVLFVSLGCDKNLVDSEVMLALLAEKGHEITDDEREAQVAIINTCCFIHDAKEESITTILELAQLKKTAVLQGIIVTGCLAERYQNEIEEELPEVDVLVGTASYEHIVEAIETVSAGGHGRYFEPINYLPVVHGKRLRSDIGFYSYLKIAEGCNKHCTYCIIPSIRGCYRSIPMEYLLEEAKLLADQGVKELVLVAQETTLYGMDLYGKKSLSELLHKLCQISGLEWIRILYCYPEEITKELIQVIKEEPKVCHYLDMPIQHASDRILHQMGRKTDRAQLTRQIERLRKEIPDIILRTTLITGFPGETQNDFEELMDFVEEMEFDHLGVFPYSEEEGTPAAVMEGQVDEHVKNARRDEIMELQQEIAARKAESRIGEEYEVLIEGWLEQEEAYVGRTYMDAPGVDGYLFLTSEHRFLSGDRVRVKVTGAREYDLYAEEV